jgi:cell wall-associated NlpC family hydrolase
MPDYSANQMYRTAVDSGAEHGSVSVMPEIPGLVLWKEGHTGVYIGGGYAIEAMGTSSGVVKTKVEGRGWQAWYKIPYITYLED